MRQCISSSAAATLALLLAARAAWGATNSPAPNRTPSTTVGGTNLETSLRSQPSKAGEFRAVWIHSPFGVKGWDWDRTISVLNSNGFNAVIANLLSAGAAHYPSQVLPVSSMVRERGDQIAECLAACRKYGIELHVWKVNHNLTSAPADFLAGLRASGRTQKDKHGKELDWLCPSHPENFALERDSMLEVVRNYSVDGIHFDYIRYPSRDACFCSGCRGRFEQALGLKIESWPDDVLTGAHAGRFAGWRRDQITRLVRAVSEEARQLKPGIKVSAAVYGGWKTTRDSIGQDTLAWIAARHLDFVCPMDYEGDDNKFADLVQMQVEMTNHRIPLYIGIGAHKLSGPEQLARQIQLARSLGAEGFVIFQLNEKVATQFLPHLRLEMTVAPTAPSK